VAIYANLFQMTLDDPRASSSMMNGFYLALRTYPTEDFFLLQRINPREIREGDPELVVSTADIVHYEKLCYI
jgi:hypothetical protein